MNDQANTQNVQPDFTGLLIAMQVANQDRRKLITSLTHALNRIKFEVASPDPNPSGQAVEPIQKPGFIVELNMEFGNILVDNAELQRIVDRLNKLI
jgi:hypothetical protein